MTWADFNTALRAYQRARILDNPKTEQHGMLLLSLQKNAARLKKLQL